MKTGKSPDKASRSARRGDFLHFLGSFGLRSLQTKAAVVILAFTITSTVMVYLVALLAQQKMGSPSGQIKGLSWSIAVGSGAILFFLIGGLSFAIMRSINKHLKALIGVTEEVAAGSFTARVAIKTGDEFESAAIGFNQMMDQLYESVRSEAKQKEALKHSELQYRSLFDRANDAILIFEPYTEEILETNIKACEMYGYSKEELVGRSLKDFTEDVSRGEQYIVEILKTEKPHNIESIHIDRDGEQGPSARELLGHRLPGEESDPEHA